MSSFRTNISFLPAFLSTSLVIFVLGFLSIFLIEANRLKKAIKEDVPMSIYFRDEANDSLIQGLQNEFKHRSFILSSKYISKEDGLKLISNNVGEKPDSLLGFNPIPKTLEIHFKDFYVSEDSLSLIKKEFENLKNVREVSYDAQMVKNIDRNIARLGWVLLALAILMSLISIALINNTVRLMMYSKRFIIKSMQFVGATRGFIMKPFLKSGFMIGLGGGIFACVLLWISLKVMGMYFPVNHVIENYVTLSLVMLGIIILSLGICLMSSYFAINRYLRLKLDDLF